MRKLFLFPLLVISLIVSAQQPVSMFVASKAGLSIREKPDAAAKVLEKIPYGTKISLIQSKEELKSIVTEGMSGFWQKVKYNNKTGYIVDSYLLPSAPPKIVKTTGDEPFGLKNYLAQITTPFGKKLIIKTGNSLEDGTETNKQLYMNGAEWHHSSGMEWFSDTYIFPGFSLKQGFLLARLIPELKEVFGDKDEYPSESKKFTRNGTEYELRVIKRTYVEGENEITEIEKITVSYSPGASYDFEMFLMNGELVILFSGGV